MLIREWFTGDDGAPTAPPIGKAPAPQAPPAPKAGMAQRAREAIARASRGETECAEGSDAQRVCESDLPDLARAFLAADGKLHAIRKAAEAVRKSSWSHGEDCPHRNCSEPEECADGSGGLGDGCESGGEACNCGVDKVDALLRAIFGEP